MNVLYAKYDSGNGMIYFYIGLDLYDVIHYDNHIEVYSYKTRRVYRYGRLKTDSLFAKNILPFGKYNIYFDKRVLSRLSK